MDLDGKSDPLRVGTLRQHRWGWFPWLRIDVVEKKGSTNADLPARARIQDGAVPHPFLGLPP